MIFFTISTILFGFSFSGISLLLADFVAYAVSDVDSGAGWNADWNVGSRFEVLCIFFYWKWSAFKVIKNFIYCAKK